MSSPLSDLGNIAVVWDSDEVAAALDDATDEDQPASAKRSTQELLEDHVFDNGVCLTCSTVERKFNPAEPRDPHTGKWIDGAPGSQALQDAAEAAVRRLAEAAVGQDALDAAPSRLVPDPDWAHGGLDGAHFTGPKGHGSARALAEYQGLEYVQTNGYLRGSYNLSEQEKAHLPDFLRGTPERVAEIDKTMRASRLTKDVQVHRVVSEGGSVFGVDAWYGDVSDDDWNAGVRPDLTGLEWREDAYVSTTVDPAVVDSYTDKKRYSDPVVLNILVPKGTGAVQLSGVGNGQEGELLVQRGVRMRVVADHGEETVTSRLGESYTRRVLDVEVVPDGG